MFQIDLQVRDYECDMQSIVNNSVYQNYFEHARHLFLKEKGMNFGELITCGINLVLYRAEIDYFESLTKDLVFKVTVNQVQRISKTRCYIYQEIIFQEKVFTAGKFFITAINDKRKPINLDKINFDILHC